MSAAGGGPSGSAINPFILLAVGVIGGLVGIYLSPVSIVGPVIAALGAVCAIVWGADAIRRVASYGLGTGVPSIGYMSLSIGIIGGIVGLSVASSALKMAIAGPILGFILALVLGVIVAVLAKVFAKMKIAVLIQCTAEISGAAALSVIGFSSALAGGFYLDATGACAGILKTVIVPGFIALFFIMNTMAIQHPFNACLGPNEDQTRTLKLAVATGFLAMVITGITTISNPALNVDGVPVWLLIVVVGAIGWIVSFSEFVKASNEAAASVKWNPYIPKVEE
jgi:tetrahydromethanopterin S-methyltransferase subunit C